MVKRHLVLCGGVSAPRATTEGKTAPALRLTLGKGRHDVHLRLDHLSKRLAAGLPKVAVDLLELAAYVYAADQAVSRGGPVEIEYGERWRRHFRFEIPLRCPQVWRRSDVKAALTETLSFLSDDDYEFHFHRLKNPPPLDGYLFDDLDGHADFEEVVLFSGGLDSLGGAVREIVQGHHKVVLVSHRPNSKIYARQDQLVTCLNDHIASASYRPLHVAVEVNKDRKLSRDFHQRSRSFLFAAVAAVVARVFGLSRLRFYENGPVSLNLPVSPQVLGGRASRTTHPRALKGLERLLMMLFEQPFRVQNPFLWHTRAEVLAQIRQAGCGSLCALTSSCTHTWEQTSDQPHCGRCSQCVDRRLAALSAGLTDEEDPPQHYRSDVVTAPLDGADLILTERFVGHLLQADDLPHEAAFLARYPEVARVLRHVDEPPARAAELALDLYHRHARAVRDGLAAAARQVADPLAWRGIPLNSLLGITYGRLDCRAARCVEPPPSVPSAACAARQCTLFLDRETFEVRLGGRACALGNTIEFRLLDRLNHRPGRYVSLDTLRQDVWGDEYTAKNTIQRTISNLRRRLREAGLAGILLDGNEKGHYRLVLPA